LTGLASGPQNFLRLGACEADSLDSVRPPGPNDRRIRTFILLDDGQVREVTARA